MDSQREIPGSLADRDESRLPGPRGLWTPGEYYVRGDTVHINLDLSRLNVLSRIPAIYRCLRSHYSSNANKPGTTGGEDYWTQDAELKTRRFDFTGDRINDVTFVRHLQDDGTYQAIEPFELPGASRFRLEDDEILNYTTSTLPAGLVFNTETREITGRPSKLTSLHRVVYRATLAATGETVFRDFHITVRDKGTPNIPRFQITAIDVEVNSVRIDWQTHAADGEVKGWKLRVSKVSDSTFVYQEDLTADRRHVFLDSTNGVDEWEAGEYLAQLAAVLQDGVVTPYMQLTFIFFGDAINLPPAPVLEITDIAKNELTASWEMPTVGDSERVSQFEARLRTGYNSYFYDAIDRRDPGSVDANQWAPIAPAGAPYVLNSDFNFTHIRDRTLFLRIGEKDAPDGSLDQQPRVAFPGTFFTLANFRVGQDYVGVKIGNNWCQWVFNGFQADPPNTGIRINLKGTGTGVNFRPEVVDSNIDEDNQHVPLNSETAIQFQGDWRDAYAVNETSKTTGGETTYTAPEPKYVFNDPVVAGQLNDGLWYDVVYRYQVTATDDAGTETAVWSEWSQVATILMADEAAKPTPPRDYQMNATNIVHGTWKDHALTSFNVDAYQVQHRTGAGAYPSTPQVTVDYDENQSTYSADLISNPVRDVTYHSQARSRAQLDDGTYVFSDWTEEESLTFGQVTRKATGFVFETGDAAGQCKWSFRAPANLGRHKVRYRRVGTSEWIDPGYTDAFTGDETISISATHATGATVSGVLTGLTGGQVYEAQLRWQTYENE